ncbi:MAG TPA: hypothetical protein VD886_20160 [Herpetosiphonaceae bacterium]|nr:hypothetical protein [Herpetosiphonaceae bacterium]
MDQKPHYYVPASEDYVDAVPWYMLPKRILFWLHMLLLPVACFFAALAFENEDAFAYNLFYLLYVIGFFILLLVSAGYDNAFLRERTLAAYRLSKRLSVAVLIAYPMLWFAALLSFAANVRIA